MTPSTPYPVLRIVLLAFITGSLGMIAHITLIRALGADVERHLHPLVIAAATLAMGFGCAAVSETMRHTQLSIQHAWEKGGLFMARALLLAAFTPAAFAGPWPIPAAGVFIAGLTTGSPLTLILSLFSILAFAAALRVPVGYSAQRYPHHVDRMVFEASTLVAIWGVVVLTGAPIFPDVSLL